MLFGPTNAHLERIERQLGVRVTSRGNTVAIDGPAGRVEEALTVLDELYRRLRDGQPVGPADIDAALRMVAQGLPGGDRPVYITRKRHIAARSPVQADYMRAMDERELVFGLGPAGTGKTYLAVAKAVSMMVKGEVDRIILSRPAVEAGERLGFLPGDMRDKVDPYLRPLYDALHDMLPGDQVAKRLAAGDIEVAPLAFMRGRTLASSFVILDEAQNTTPVQMKMFLTRLGEHSRMVVTGDLSQIDLPAGSRSGLKDALDILEGVPSIGVVRFTDRDVVRHGLVAEIVRAYDNHDRHREGRNGGGAS
ncbi:PhoH family protein [Telmatospirillum siberiense]|uniref:PhoH-like protein n=1 Tax=Telmatospirillum siberiense TaxID=382514 RepID=A0A2N3PSL1_9PROT|nr:PhoH family protein [Telmatospirillum siberiense]PKU23388.1 phosphate starvation-inducible protein PhoH [Telmatospirillum siberiense]